MQKFYVNAFVVDTAATPAESLAGGKFGGQTVEINPLAMVASVTQAATVAAEATANGTDAATTQALANALKTKVNAILTSLKAAKLML